MFSFFRYFIGNTSGKINTRENVVMDDDDDIIETVTFISPVNNMNNTDYLQNIGYANTVPFVPPITLCKVIKVYDGDTITVAARLPNTETPIYRFQVRLNGIDTAEIKGGSVNETIIAKQTRAALSELIFDKIVELRNCNIEKYGRILADVYLQDLHVNKWLIDNKYAVEYDGGKKHRPDAWE
jgi:endonuclease YncB( thermonuclease family)